MQPYCPSLRCSTVFRPAWAALMRRGRRLVPGGWDGCNDPLRRCRALGRQPLLTGDAHLAAAGFEQGALIEVRPLPHGGIYPGIQCCGARKRDAHGLNYCVHLYWHACLGLAAVLAGLRYGASSCSRPMLRELVLAIGIPLLLLLLLLAVLALERWSDQLPRWLQRLVQRPSWLWNTGIGLIIGLTSAAQAAGALRIRVWAAPGSHPP